jgi:membrane protein implicated in regulation of membrane protease activity
METTLDIAYVWMIVGALLVGLETLALPGVGLFFAGLGAITVGVALLLGLPHTLVAQTTLFFAATALWTLLLWKPMKRLLASPGGGYSDMIGQPVVADGEVTKKGGQVKWSGTIMSARLVPDAGIERMADKATGTIVKVDGGTVVVTPDNA